MSRPKKRRTVCDLPRFSRFGPLGAPHGAEGAVIMTVDEYETLRLIEGEGLTQQEASERMQVSRTTVQAIHDRASRKIAVCLVNGRELIIEGGDYRVCTSNRRCRQNTSCPRHGRRLQTEEGGKPTFGEKEEGIMPIAVPMKDDGKTIDELLARAAQFAIVEGGEVRFVANKAANSEGAGIKAAQQLVDLGVDAVITSQCGVNAAELLAAAGIALYRAKGNSLDGNLAACRKGALERLTDAVPGFRKTPRE